MNYVNKKISDTKISYHLFKFFYEQQRYESKDRTIVMYDKS